MKPLMSEQKLGRVHRYLQENEIQKAIDTFSVLEGTRLAQGCSTDKNYLFYQSYDWLQTQEDHDLALGFVKIVIEKDTEIGTKFAVMLYLNTIENYLIDDDKNFALADDIRPIILETIPLVESPLVRSKIAWEMSTDLCLLDDQKIQKNKDDMRSIIVNSFIEIDTSILDYDDLKEVQDFGLINLILNIESDEQEEKSMRKVIDSAREKINIFDNERALKNNSKSITQVEFLKANLSPNNHLKS